MTNATVDLEMIPAIIQEAREAAYEAADKFFNERLGGQDQYACGFAWVNIWGVKMNTKLGKAFKAAGLDKDYSGAISIWNPSGINVQNVDVKEAGAEAAAKVFTKYGFTAYAGSRLD
tara:strand:- start:194 stop:544 length:351 start_codon:yes stop_codon:yes gene_type:complete